MLRKGERKEGYKKNTRSSTEVCGTLENVALMLEAAVKEDICNERVWGS